MQRCTKGTIDGGPVTQSLVSHVYDGSLDARASHTDFIGCCAARQRCVVSGLRVETRIAFDYDKSTDFSKYHSFNFAETPSTETLGYGNLITQQIESLDQIGASRSAGICSPDKPDPLVNFSGKLQKDGHPSPRPAGG